MSSLKHAGFIPKSIDTVLEKRQTCRMEPVGKHMNTEHVDVPPDFSDVQLAEVFIHHRVLIVPVTDDKRVDRGHHARGLLPRARRALHRRGMTHRGRRHARARRGDHGARLRRSG